MSRLPDATVSYCYVRHQSGRDLQTSSANATKVACYRVSTDGEIDVADEDHHFHFFFSAGTRHSLKVAKVATLLTRCCPELPAE